MIKGVTDDSRLVKPGYAYVAIKGLTFDGHKFIQEALKNGAIEVYGEQDLKGIKNYQKVNDSKQKLAELASKFYNNPSSKIKVIGVTGTKGKTTTVHLIAHILNALGQKTGIISSISVPGYHVTTPDVVTLNKMLSDMANDGCKYAVVEVSSHGIDQGRIMGINFEAGVLTNIAPEHLDYHKTFKEYKRVKMSFVNSANKKIISPEKTGIKILTGDFNNLNAQVAVDTVVALGFDKSKALETLKTFKLPEGRMEEIKTQKNYRVFIDFAHTPNSLEAALLYLRKICKGRLISVFGCAAERDTKKRSKMGQVSTKIADLSVFTTEDSRRENIFNIFRRMKSKAIPGKFVSIPERGEAIAYALSQARKGDVVAIFGKGHEKSMSYFGFEHPWDEKEIVRAQLNFQKGVSAVILAAGKGTRMHSQRPKVLREICGRPVLSYVLENLRKNGIIDIVVVVSFRKNQVMQRFPLSVNYAYQQNPKGGTGDALRSGLEKVSKNTKYVLGFYGDDSAFFKPETTNKILKTHIQNKSVISFASLDVANPFGLGRVLRDQTGKVIGIVEEKEATDEQKKITEVNCGHFVFNKDWLARNIKKIRVSTTGEIYIVDLIKMAIKENQKVDVYKLSDPDEWHGINTPEQLEEANKKMEVRLR